MILLSSTQENTTYRGQLKVSVTAAGSARPVAGASIKISYTGVPESTLEELSTDSSGQSETVSLPAPPLEYSLDRNS